MKSVAEVGAAVARAREAQGLTLRQLAEVLDCAPSTVQSLERGGNVGGDLLVRAVAWLGDGDPFAMGWQSGRESALAEVQQLVKRIRA